MFPPSRECFLDLVVGIAEVGLVKRGGVLLVHAGSGRGVAGLDVGADERCHDASVERGGLEEAAEVIDSRGRAGAEARQLRVRSGRRR